MKWDGPTCPPHDPNNKTCGDPAGTETDVDCGGGGCAPCLLDQCCLINSDCKSNNCSAVAVGDAGTPDGGVECAFKCAPPAVCSVADAGAPWVPYDPDAGDGG
jgi:hypothetical protein